MSVYVLYEYNLSLPIGISSNTPDSVMSYSRYFLQSSSFYSHVWRRGLIFLLEFQLQLYLHSYSLLVDRCRVSYAFVH